MKERYIATVDLGTSKLALAVARVAEDASEVLYYKQIPSDGVRYGAVYNPAKASVPLKAAISEAEKELSIKITQVVVGVPRSGIRQEVSSAKLERGSIDTCISQEEVNDIKNLALDSYPLDDAEKQEIYGAVAQSFSTDDSYGCTEEDVVGMPSAMLEGNFKVFVGLKRATTNIDIMLNMVDVALARRYFLPPLIADAVLSADERENGVALIEIGAGVSSVTIYQGGILRYYQSIPFGGQSVTGDIKLECSFGARLAENVKMGFGACMPDKLQTMSDKVLRIVDEANGTEQLLPVKYLSEIITARMREIIDALLFRIQESGYADRLRAGVVLSGGGAELAGCAGLIKEMSGYNVRTGYPRMRCFSYSGFPGLAEADAAATVGMLMSAREDAHLNCIDAIPVRRKEEVPTAAEPLQEEAEQEKEDDTVFAPAPEEKPRKSEKPRKQKSEGRLITWVKRNAREVAEKGEGFVGNLFAQMDEN